MDEKKLLRDHNACPDADSRALHYTPFREYFRMEKGGYAFMDGKRTPKLAVSIRSESMAPHYVGSFGFIDRCNTRHPSRRTHMDPSTKSQVSSCKIETGSHNRGICFEIYLKFVFGI